MKQSLTLSKRVLAQAVQCAARDFKYFVVSRKMVYKRQIWAAVTYILEW